SGTRWTAVVVMMGMRGLSGWAQDPSTPKSKEEAEQRAIESQKKLTDLSAAAQGVQKAASDSAAAAQAATHDSNTKAAAAQKAVTTVAELQKKADASKAALTSDGYKKLEQEAKDLATDATNSAKAAAD